MALASPPSRRELSKRRSIRKVDAVTEEALPFVFSTDVALAWLLKNPVVTAPIIGPRTMEQLTGALRAVELKLSDDTLQRLDRIFPGPGGEAPEAYAW